jgi:iron-sulfur cluster repair protein YtfE (RIC family)/CBS domain-containing protein
MAPVCIVKPAPNDWDGRSALALVAHIAERHHDTQRAELERLRELFVALDRVAPPSISFTIRTELALLEDAARAHLATTTLLFPYVVALEANERAPSLQPSDVARLLQRLHGEHERLRAIVGCVRRVTLDCLSLDTASSLLARTLDAALAGFEHGARDHADLERVVLVPRVLSLDPSVERDTTPVMLPVRRREVVSATGRHEALSVFCPSERRSFTPEWCSTCPLVREVNESSVRCTPPAIVPSRSVTLPRRTGEDLCVGEALGQHHVSVGLDVTAKAVADALGKHGDAVAVVVDETGHFAGTIDRDLAECAHAGQLAGELRQAGPCIGESAPLADAIACMVKTHQRSLPVVGADGRVLGLLVDIDALHRIVDSKRR